MTKPVIDPVDALAKHLKVPVEDIQVWNDDSMTLVYNDKVEYYAMDWEEKQIKMPDTWAHFEEKIGDYYIYKV